MLLALVAGVSLLYAVRSEIRVKSLEGELASLRRERDEAMTKRAEEERARAALATAVPTPTQPPVPVAATPEPPTPAPEGDLLAELTSSDGGVSQKLDSAAILAVMNKLRPAMKRCYEVALAEDPKASGRVAVSLTIAPAGTVSNVTATPAGKLPPSVAACVARVVRTAHFPAAKEPTSVNYPVVFAAAD